MPRLTDRIEPGSGRAPEPDLCIRSRIMRRQRFTQLAVAGTVALVLAAAAVALVAAKRSGSSSARSARALVFKKGDADRIAAGQNAEAVAGPNERRGPDFSPD